MRPTAVDVGFEVVFGHVAAVGVLRALEESRHVEGAVAAQAVLRELARRAVLAGVLAVQTAVRIRFTRVFHAIHACRWSTRNDAVEVLDDLHLRARHRVFSRRTRHRCIERIEHAELDEPVVANASGVGEQFGAWNQLVEFFLAAQPAIFTCFVASCGLLEAELEACLRGTGNAEVGGRSAVEGERSATDLRVARAADRVFRNGRDGIERDAVSAVLADGTSAAGCPVLVCHDERDRGGRKCFRRFGRQVQSWVELDVATSIEHARLEVGAIRGCAEPAFGEGHVGSKRSASIQRLESKFAIAVVGIAQPSAEIVELRSFAARGEASRDKRDREWGKEEKMTESHAPSLRDARATRPYGCGWGLGRRAPTATRSPKCSNWIRVACTDQERRRRLPFPSTRTFPNTRACA